jgi:hypothetical protein
MLGVADLEIVGGLVAIVAPFSGQLDAQEVQDRLALPIWPKMYADCNDDTFQAGQLRDRSRELPHIE